jgi:hypothetical protein
MVAMVELNFRCDVPQNTPNEKTLQSKRAQGAPF